MKELRRSYIECVRLVMSELYTAKALVFEPRPFEFEIAVQELERYKSSGTCQIPT